MTVAGSPDSPARQPAQIEAATSAQAKVEGGVDTRDAGIVTSHATPSRREVLAAIIRTADDNGERLLRVGRLDSQPSVGVVDHFRLVSLDLQGNSGLAEVEVKEIATFQYGKPNSNRLMARQRVILSRQEQGWILLMPQDLMYINRHIAARVLTNQLANLSQSPADQLQASFKRAGPRPLPCCLLSIARRASSVTGLRSGLTAFRYMAGCPVDP